MFTFESMVDQGVKTYKSVAEHIPHVTLSRELSALAEAQGEFVKSLYSFGMNVSKSLVELGKTK
jgi:viroplasmin and RNaseH domain-containing protein